METNYYYYLLVYDYNKKEGLKQKDLSMSRDPFRNSALAIKNQFFFAWSVVADIVIKAR